jgi:hypothetical protein
VYIFQQLSVDRPSLEKCKKIKEMRELNAELAGKDVQ